VDQREWDAGARLPRDRHATETRSTQNGPESPEKPQWGAVADTGSLQPSPEALAWTQRAEAWAEQPPEPEQRSPGSQTYPVDGVGWRTETAEWLAAEQTARWRQTTEWRSASGDHGWRSTTEAWQTGGNAEGFRPLGDAATHPPLAISSTAWSGDQPTGATEPPQRYATPPQTFTTHRTPPGWQQFDGTSPLSSAPDTRPAWQQFAAPATPWQAAGAAPQGAQIGPPPESAPGVNGQSVDSADTVSRPPWQQAVPAPPVAVTQPVDTANTVSSPPWQQSVAMPAQRRGEGNSWQQLIEPARPGTYTSSGSAGLEKHRPPDEDAGPWRGPGSPDQPWGTSAVGVAGVGNGRVVGRRRAPEDVPRPPEDVPRPPEDDRWAPEDDRWAPEDDRWAPGDESRRPEEERRSPADERPVAAWEPEDDRADAATWRDRSDVAGAHHADRSGWSDETEPRHRSEAAGWDDSDDDWDDRTSGPAEPPTGRRYAESAAPQWRRADPEPGWRDRSDGWRSEPDSGSWSRGEEPRTVNWRRRRLDHVDDDTDAPGWRDAGPHTDGWRRDARPAADPWAQHAADTGFIPMSWDQPGTHAGSWRSDPEDRDEPEYRARRRIDEEPLDSQVWRGGRGRLGGGGNWPADEPENQRDRYREPPAVGEAATEVRQRIDPERWAGATYRGGNTGDWRRELAEESDLADGEARRFGTQDFVPFRPAGPAPPPAYGTPEPPGPVGRTNGARWNEPPDTQWPPHGAVIGSYERRAADSFSGASGRSNLLEPEDEAEENNGGPLAAVGYTVIWYGVPVVLFVLYMLVVTGDEKAHALSTLANAAPQFGLSLAVSMLVAVILRWLSGSWKAASVGLAAAVMGGGLATVLASAITGNPLS
jgi:hypothetical protein